MHFDASFFVAVATIAFIFIAFRPVAKLVGNALDSRSEGIRKDLDEARSLKEEAQALLAKYQRKQQQSVEEAEGMIAHAEEEAGRIIRDAKEQAKQDIDRRMALAMDKIAQAEASVVNEIKDSAVDITMNAARSLIIEHLDNDSAEDIIQVAIEDIDRKLH